jgi:hypothetical protein
MTDKIALWTDDFLDAKRLQTDPKADDLIRYVFENDMVTTFNEILRLLTVNDQTVRSGVGPMLAMYLMDTMKFPDWFDINRYHRTCYMFRRYELQVLASLLFASLPTSYAGAKGAHVLVRTYRLTNNPQRRVMETLQMLRDLLQADGLNPEGRGIRAMQKVRLLHAGTRYHLLNHDWDTDYYGLPINQEDMAGTGVLFSYKVLEALPKFGVELTDEQVEDYIHTWSFISYMMGVDEDLLPHSFEEAHTLYERVAERHFVPNEDGEYLTRTLAEMVAEYIPGHKATVTIPYALVRYLSGDDIADKLNVSKVGWVDMLRPFKFAAPFLNSSKSFKNLAVRASAMIFMGFYENEVLSMMQDNQASFSVPAYLNPMWKLEEEK